MYKLFLCLRYLRKRRIAFFAIGAVTLCTAMVLIVMSVMGGFLDMVRERSRGLLGDIVMDNGSMQGFGYYQEFIDRIKTTMPDKIVQATPVIYSYGILRFPDYNITKPVRVVGIDLEAYQQVNDFANSLFYNKCYPGTTTFQPARLPVWGITPAGIPTLPEDLMAARQKWLATLTDPQDKARYALEASGRYPGPGFYCPSPLQTDVEEILVTLAEHFNIDRQNLQSPASEQAVALARKIGMHLAWELTHLEISEIGDVFGETDPEAVRDIIQEVGEKRTADPQFNRLLVDLSFRLIGPRYIGPEYPSLIIGIEMVAQRNEQGQYDRIYPRGEKVILSVMPLTRKGAESGTGPVQIAMRYIDDSRTGVYDIDVLCVYGDFNYLQKQLGMEPKDLVDGSGMTPARTSQISIKLAPGTDPYEMRDVLKKEWQAFHAGLTDKIDENDNRLMSNVEVETWEERQREFIAAVEKEKVLVTILFAVISVVAVFLVGCIFYMIVQEKTRDIGIIKSVGATSYGVASIFLSYGAAVGIVGSLLGTAFGVFFVRYINEMQDVLAKVNPNLRVWSPAVYTFDQIPNQVDPKEALTIVIIAVVASMLGSLVAAMRAARVWPVEALRYE